MKTYSKASDIRVGVIGYGGAFNMGKAHLDLMSKAGMVPAAVAELDPERLKVATADYPGIETYASVEAMLEQSSVDLVTIITPHNTHAALALQCLESGRHVVCEKPLSITTEECDVMIEAATSRGLLLSTFHNRHWDGCILEAVERIRKGDTIGQVIRVEAHMGGYGKPGDWWRSSRSISGGIHYDWGVHLIEYVLQIVDAEVVEVSGFAHEGFWQTRWGADTNQDELSAIVRFSNGALLNLRISNLESDPPKGWIKFTGTKGCYIMDGPRYEIHRWSEGEKIVTSGKNRESEGFRYYENVAAALTGTADLIITPEWSRRPVHILDLASQSVSEGRTLPARYR